jgi:hypothetical protein
VVGAGAPRFGQRHAKNTRVLSGGVLCGRRRFAFRGHAASVVDRSATVTTRPRLPTMSTRQGNSPDLISSYP